MKIGVYLCQCGGNVTAAISYDRVSEALLCGDPQAYTERVDFLCSAEGKEAFLESLKAKHPDRVVVAACSPREYETLFRQILADAGINSYYLQMVNVREQIAWVTADPARATEKAITGLRAAMARVRRQEALESREVEASSEVLVIGAGTAGLQAALTLAEAGRKVMLVEKSPAIGGKTVLYEELFPTMECGPCLLEPVEAEVLHGDYAHNIELLLLSEVAELNGYFGNFTAKIRQRPRCVGEQCIGCGLCVEACPASSPNPFNCGISEKKAMSLPFLGALPNAPYIDQNVCVRAQGRQCQACADACPIPGTVRLDEQERTLERKVGAVIVAIGSKLYDSGEIPFLGYGKIENVYSSLEFERIAAANGPTGGHIVTKAGKAPASLAIVHCVGSLDAARNPHCSGICCSYALKFNRMVEHKLPGTRVYHLYRELVVAGKDGFTMLDHARENHNSVFIRYRNIDELAVSTAGEGQRIVYTDAGGTKGAIDTDMVVLCPAMLGAEDSDRLAVIAELGRNQAGFFDELNGRLHAAQSKVKGIYLAGSCQAPMDIREATSQGMAAAGYILSSLVEGKKLTVDPIFASVIEERCSGCQICGGVCPYKAITFLAEERVSSINPLLCHGCGTCVSACPAGAIKGNHFTNDQILAEIEAILQ